MNLLYRTVGISKQGFHQRLDRLLSKLEMKSQLLSVLVKVRKDHPKMSARKMYHVLKPEAIGRDAFIQWAYREGFKMANKKRLNLSYNPLSNYRFPNLIAGKELTGVNQVWVSDITYYQVKDKTFYVTMIMDLYSRRIVGHHASKSLQTIHTTLPALNQAIKARKGSMKDLIFHSDGGGQYYSKVFLRQTKQQGIRNSMSYQVLENAHAERLMGVIKNDYLKGYNPQNLSELKTALNKAVKMYNEQKPHGALQLMSPSQYEEKLAEIKPVEMWITPRYIPVKVTHIPTRQQ